MDDRAVTELRRLAELDASLSEQASALQAVDGRVARIRARAEAIDAFFAAYPERETQERAEVRKAQAQTTNIGGGWHTDHSYDRIPAMGSILVARILPAQGGDTMFANMSAAYEALDDETKAQIADLKAVHSNAHVFGSKAYGSNPERTEFANDDAVSKAVHPVVITHPLSGRKSLYVNPGFTTRFDGKSPTDSRPLLHKLFAHAMQPRFVSRFQWRPGSIAFWDNRATWHFALNDYHGEERQMHRITVAGVALH